VREGALCARVIWERYFRRRKIEMVRTRTMADSGVGGSTGAASARSASCASDELVWRESAFSCRRACAVMINGLCIAIEDDGDGHARSLGGKAQILVKAIWDSDAGPMAS